MNNMNNIDNHPSHADSIENIENFIKNSPPFKHFLKNNPDILLEYKNFEVTIAASAVYYLLCRQLDVENNARLNASIKEVYFKRTSSFLNSQVLSGNLSLDLISTLTVPDETSVVLQVFGKFHQYVDNIGSSLKDNMPYWVEELTKPDFDEEFGYISGIKHYYPFVLNILTSEIQEESGSRKYVNTRQAWEVGDADVEQLHSFIEVLNSVF